VIDFLVSVSNIFIDDVVTWKEEIQLGVMGGAGPHALAGCGVWNKNLGIVASVGEDFRHLLGDLHGLGIDTQGICFDQEKTNRQWEIFQPGEIRIGVRRDPRILFKQAAPKFDQLDRKYSQAAGYHILWQGAEKDLFVLLDEIKLRNPESCIVYEPAIQDCEKNLEYFQKLFARIDGFSPSASEGKSILNTDSPEEIIEKFIGMGCKWVALRLGSAGSMAGSRSGERYKIPAAEGKVVDVTGAGNAYAGGLLCGLSTRKSMKEVLAMASVSASFAIEQYGLCKFNDEMIPIRDKRFSQVMNAISIIR
jgi:sugar/nucleoside kinase (ribokinase family)